MSRSYKKHASSAVCCYFSNKEDKQTANRTLRHKNKQIINNNMSFNKDYYVDDIDIVDGEFVFVDYSDEYPIEQLSHADFKILREVSDVWGFQSDGLTKIYTDEELIIDESVPFYWQCLQRPVTTIKQAKKDKNWKTLKHYLMK